ncbi:hypothetical protein AB0M43_34725 [Longispora sp. NPDC051575]|uniref:hypothetical protein n=1 Tax=Longispora sp. NPDC051575 TaxID=3154943 RepID=UPI00341A96E2
MSADLAVRAVYLGALHTYRDPDSGLYAIVGLYLQPPSGALVPGWLDPAAGAVCWQRLHDYGWCAIGGAALAHTVIDASAPRLVTPDGAAATVVPTSRGPVDLLGALLYEARPETEGWSLWSRTTAPSSLPTPGGR